MLLAPVLARLSTVHVQRPGLSNCRNPKQYQTGAEYHCLSEFDKKHNHTLLHLPTATTTATRRVW